MMKLLIMIGSDTMNMNT